MDDESPARTQILLLSTQHELATKLACFEGVRIAHQVLDLALVERDKLAIIVLDGRDEARFIDVERAATSWRSAGGSVVLAYESPPGTRHEATTTEHHRRLARRWNACVIEAREPRGLVGLVEVVAAFHDSLHLVGLVGLSIEDVLMAIAAPAIGEVFVVDYTPGSQEWSLPQQTAFAVARADRLLLVIRFVPETTLHDINSISLAVSDAGNTDLVLVSCPEGAVPTVTLLAIRRVTS